MSNFSHAEIIEKLTTDFVPLAIDQWYERRQQDSVGEFYRKIMKQGSRNDFNSTTQGKYAVAPDGTLLGETNHRAPERLIKMLDAALEKYEPQKTEAIVAETVDETYARVLPKNGMVVRVHTKILDGYEEPDSEWQKIFQSSVARDNLWMTEEEVNSLAKGSFPKSLARRIARFNLIDNTRGEPPMWNSDEIRSLEIKLSDGIVQGKFRLETNDKQRGFDGEFHGHVESNDNKLTRFDLVAKGDFWGEGRYTGGAPEGKFPIAMAFRLADGTDAADRVAPQGTKGWLPNYWE